MLGQFPVGHVVLEPAEGRIDVDLVARRRPHPQHAVLLGAWQFDQSATGLVEVAEPLGPVDGDQVATVGVRPGVEWTTEPGLAAAAVGYHLGAAMATGVGEGPELTGIVARHQDGQPRLAVGPVAPVSGKSADRPMNRGVSRKKDALLLGQQVGACEVGQRALDDAVAVYGAAVGESVFEDMEQPGGVLVYALSVLCLGAGGGEFSRLWRDVNGLRGPRGKQRTVALAASDGCDGQAVRERRAPWRFKQPSRCRRCDGWPAEPYWRRHAGSQR